MNIHHIIVHSIKKEQHQAADIKVNLRQSELTIDKRVVTLVEGIRDVYTNKTGKAFGQLGEDKFFSTQLHKMYTGQLTFIKFTNQAMKELKAHMAAQSLATGGYLIFADFESHEARHFMVVMLKSKQGLSFDEELGLMDTQHLELDKLHFAAMIDVDVWNSEMAGNNVSFIKGRASATVSDYFKAFLGIQEFSESSTITQHLINAVSNFYRHELQLDNVQVEEYKKRVHDYCHLKHDNEESIFLDELSRFLDEHKPTKFMKYAQKNYEIPNEFQVDRNRLRKFLRYSGKDQGVSISFTSDAFGKRVKYNPDKDVLTIKQIPKALREQLVAELYQQDNSRTKG